MRKLFFIIALIVLSCTQKKVQRQTDVSEVEASVEEAPKYVYTDSSNAEVKVFVDSAESIYEDNEIAVEDEVVAAEPDTLEIDTTLYRYSLTISQDSVNAWKNLKSFAYTKYLDSLLKAEKNKKKAEEKEAPQEKYEPRGESWLDGVLSSGALQVILWILAGGFVLFVLYKLFITGGPLRRSSVKANEAPIAEEEVITAESDFDRMIREACQLGNYRLAVRYHYLQTLHKLAENNFVEMAVDKTNYQYVREVKDTVKQNEFAGLTLNYEYVWYGEFAIDEIQYLKIKNGFAHFNTKIG